MPKVNSETMKKNTMQIKEAGVICQKNISGIIDMEYGT
jgi:hypothetical protein